MVNATHPGTTAAEFNAADQDARRKMAFWAQHWVAGFCQAKILSHVALEKLSPDDRVVSILMNDEKLILASQTYLDSDLDQQVGLLDRACKRFPDNDVSMNLLLILADLNASQEAVNG